MPHRSQKDFFPSVNWRNPLTKGLVFAWVPTEQNATAPESDLVTRGRSTVTNIASSAIVMGQYGLGVNFANGTTDRIAFGDRPSLDPLGTRGFTASLWLNGLPTNATNLLLSKKATAGGADGWSLRSEVTQKLSWRHDGTLVTSTGAPSAGPLHLVCAWDGANLMFYFNGVLDSSPALTAAATSAGQSFNIGSNAAVNSVGMTLHGVAIWNRYLKPVAINRLFSDPWALFTSQEVWQAAYFGAALLNTTLVSSGSTQYAAGMREPLLNGGPLGTYL